MVSVSIREHAWVVGLVPSWSVCRRQQIDFSHVDVSHSLSLPSSLSGIKKNIISIEILSEGQKSRREYGEILFILHSASSDDNNLHKHGTMIKTKTLTLVQHY